MFKSVKVGGRSARCARARSVQVHRLGRSSPDSTSARRRGLAQVAAKRAEATGETGCIVAFPDRQGRRHRRPSARRQEQVRPEAARLQRVARRHLAKVKASFVAIEPAAHRGRKGRFSACGRAFGESIGILAWDADQFRGSVTTRPSVRLSLRSSDKAFSAGIYGIGLGESTNVARTSARRRRTSARPSLVAKEACARPLHRHEVHGHQGAKLLKRNSSVSTPSGWRPTTAMPRPARVHTQVRRTREETHRPRRKTITYDSGGLSLKISGSMA